MTSPQKYDVETTRLAFEAAGREYESEAALWRHLDQKAAIYLAVDAGITTLLVNGAALLSRVSSGARVTGAVIGALAVAAILGSVVCFAHSLYPRRSARVSLDDVLTGSNLCRPPEEVAASLAETYRVAIRESKVSIESKLRAQQSGHWLTIAAIVGGVVAGILLLSARL